MVCAVFAFRVTKRSPILIQPCSVPFSSPTIFLELPLTIVQRANLPRLQPPTDAVEVEGVVAHSPSHSAILRCVGTLVRLTFNAQVHDVVSANGAVINNNIPRPQCHGIPFLDLKPLLGSCASGARCGGTVHIRRGSFPRVAGHKRRNGERIGCVRVSLGSPRTEINQTRVCLEKK